MPPFRRFCDRRQVGGKAEGLIRLAMDGFAVPSFCVISSEAKEVLGFRPTGERICEDSQQHAAPLLERALGHMVADGKAVAVRSSALSEDGELQSCAGMGYTALDIRTVDALAAAVFECWTRASSPPERCYRARMEIPCEESTAVIVQTLVRPALSGVMFTAHPVLADPSHIEIEAAHGIGGAVLGAPDERFGLDKVTGDIRYRHAPPGINTLMSHELSSLHALARQVESTYGPAKDIEWAITRSEGRSTLHILQMRNLTGMTERKRNSPTKPALHST